MLKPVSKAVVSNQVFEQLRDEILDRQYMPGDNLPPERELCEILNVNRSSVREALKRLEQARLVEIKQGGGITVLDFSIHAGFDLLPWLVMPGGTIDALAIRSMLEFKLLINPEIARYAAMRIQYPELKQLKSIVDKIDECDEDDFERFQDLDFRFHYTMARSGENLAFILLYNSFKEIYDQGRLFFTGLYEQLISRKKEYRKIYNAIAANNSKKAFKLCRDLTEFGNNVFAEMLDLDDRATQK